jgi:transcription elongation factor GreA
MTKTPMTVDGKKQLDEELKHLKSKERPAVIEAIEEARAHGDLSENAEYSAAKEKQAFIEGRIQEIQSKLAGAEVIDPSKIDSSKVVFGARVKLLDLDSDEELSYFIVGEDEADFKAGKISVTSPIARGLIGKEEGDEVVIRTPGGEKNFEVLEIVYE